MDSESAGIRTKILETLKPNQKILAVSKLQPIEKIKALYDQGQINFGENYMQEALAKIESLQNLKIQWHLIGPLQRNKVKFLKKNFAFIHSVDSIELAELISKKAVEIDHRQKVFLQINISGENSKSGFNENIVVNKWAHLNSLPGLQIVGLMTMPPLENEPEKNRIYFKKLVALGKNFDLHEFSMGTSHDYSVALEEGATWIRIGSLLFGARNSQPDNETRSQ